MRAKRWLALFLIFAMAVGLAVTPVAAESVLEGSDSLKNNTVTFSVGANPDTVVYAGAPVNVLFTVSLSSDSNQMVDAFSFVLDPSSNLSLAKEEYSEQNRDFYYQLVLGDVTDASILDTYGEYDFAVNEEGTRYYFGAAKKSCTGRDFTGDTAVLKIVGQINEPGEYTLGLVTTGNDAVVAGQVTGSGDNTTSSYFRRIVKPATVTVVSGGVISGTVKDDADQPMGGAAVTLKDSKGDVAAETVADESGSYTLPAVANGDYTLSVSATVGDKTLSGSKAVTVNGSGENGYQVDAGAIAIQEGIRGDVNGDGQIKGNDALMLKRYLKNNSNAITSEYGADVDGNGKINGADALKLAKYLKNPDNNPL